MRTLLLLAAAAGLVGTLDRTRAVSTTAPVVPAASIAARASVPFRVGERLTYRAKINFLNAGTATMTVVGIDDVRGHPAYHTMFEVKGRVLFFHVDDHYESWFDTATLVSLRHLQHIDETSYKANRTYEFFPSAASISAMARRTPASPSPWTKARSSTSCARHRSKSAKHTTSIATTTSIEIRSRSSRPTRVGQGARR